uniref:Major sperm protein n=1 Tax=Caenorhabditis tropicalis TaxID=1561998 RepID=A0A1I7UG25_9PELO
MKPPELPPFHFDRKLVTFIGRIGCEPVTTTLTIFNTTKLPFLFKVKSSNNELFKMIPHLGLVDALSDACIKIIYGGIHVPPPYQEFITVHSMLPDFFNPNIYKTFKEKTNYENRHKFLVDFAYHEDLNELFGDQSEQNFQKNRRYANMWVSPAAIAGKREEMERRLREKLIVGSPKREVKDRRERKIKFFNEHSKNSEWAKSLKKKPIGVKPMKTYKWRGQGTEEKKEDEKKSEEGRTENKRKKRRKRVKMRRKL